MIKLIFVDFPQGRKNMVDSDCSLQQLNNKQNKHNLFFIFKNSKKKTRTKYDKKKIWKREEILEKGGKEENQGFGHTLQ